MKPLSLRAAALLFLSTLAGFGGYASPVEAKVLCTVIADAKTGSVVYREGDCSTRVTPASTFKIPLAVMGYDAGFLKNAHAPVLEMRKGEPDWGGENWRKPVDPVSWQQYSVVWYSQRIAHFLGEQRLRAYASAFGLGNADMSGDPGKHNGLERSWISSSLVISPLEQIAFLAKLVNGTLPASPEAMAMTRHIVQKGGDSDGWEIHGKTGMAYPRKPEGEFDEDRPWGWYVGWATRGPRTLVFARLLQDEKRTPGIASWRARDELIQSFAVWADTARTSGK